MSKAKDRQAIDELFKEFHYVDDLGLIKSKLTKLCATIRQEERRAAFTDAITWAKKVHAVKVDAARDAASSDEFAAMRLGHEADGVQRVIETLEATANDQKAPDGDRP